jgi:hypothetical protein
MTSDWWDSPPTRIRMRFTADQIHADLDPGGTGIRLDDGQTRVTLHPTNPAALVELHNLIGILLDQLDTTRP